MKRRRRKNPAGAIVLSVLGGVAAFATGIYIGVRNPYRLFSRDVPRAYVLGVTDSAREGGIALLRQFPTEDAIVTMLEKRHFSSSYDLQGRPLLVR
jgi:hypothetical protein